MPFGIRSKFDELLRVRQILCKRLSKLKRTAALPSSVPLFLCSESNTFKGLDQARSFLGLKAKLGHTFHISELLRICTTRQVCTAREGSLFPALK